MDTNKLIDQLSADLKPVEPLRPAGTRTLGFILFLSLTIIVILYVTGLRADIRGVMTEPRFIVENLLLIMAGISAAFAAFRLSVPDTRIRPPVIAALVLTTLAWAITGFACCLGLMNAPAAEAVHADGMPCIRDLAVMTALPLIVVLAMMARAAPVWSGWTGYGAVLAVGSFGAVAMRLLCPDDHPAHLLLWHFLPVIGFAACGVMIGKFLFRK